MMRREKAVEQVLRVERRLKANDDNDFSLSTADSIIQQFDQDGPRLGDFEFAGGAGSFATNMAATMAPAARMNNISFFIVYDSPCRRGALLIKTRSPDVSVLR